MAKFIALWGRPNDEDEFERHYREVHVPLCAKWPGVQELQTTKVTRSLTGGAPAQYLVFTASFASTDDLKNALKSPEMAEAGKDAQQAAGRYGCTLELLTGDDL